MRHKKTTDQTPPSAELQLAGLIAKLDPKNQKLIKPMRSVLRKRFPTVNELVYDYTKSLVISYSPNERGSDGILAISADANGIRLFFNQGINLADPHGMLLGDGRQTRYISIEASGCVAKKLHWFQAARGNRWLHRWIQPPAESKAHRRCSTAVAPASVQNMPDCLSR